MAVEEAAVRLNLLTCDVDELVRIQGWSYDDAAGWIERTLTTDLLA